jgi:CHAT domain
VWFRSLKLMSTLKRPRGPSPKAPGQISGTLLRIEVQERDSLCLFVFRAGGRTLQIPSVRWDQVPEARKAIRAALEEFQNAVGDSLKVVDWPSLDNALAELDKTGHSLLFKLFGTKGTQDLFAFLTKRAPSMVSAPDATGHIPVVELDSNGDYIHFETLPVLGFGGRPKVTGKKSLRRAMTRLLGMSSIIRRTSLKPPNQDLKLRKTGKLPIKFFRDTALPGSVTEAEFFKDFSQHFDLDGPWPKGRVAVGNFAERLAGFLAQPDTTFSGRARDPVDQIHHISCHCYIGEELSHDNRLEFSNGVNSYSATLRDLQAAYSEIFRTLPRERPSPPLAFLNACTSVSVDVRELCSFPGLLLESHRGVIGTETRIPDVVAAEFSAAFYRSLLNGYTVGESLHSAKWYLIEEHNNPLGLVYTLYADPNLYVSQPNPRGGVHARKEHGKGR